MGRFLNADAYISTGQGKLGSNMFAYCNNNPVIMYDPSGYSFEESVGGSKRLVETIMYAGYAAGGGAAILLIPQIVDGLNKAIPSIVHKVTYLAEELTSAVEHAYKRLQKRAEDNYQYWEAYLINGIVCIGRGLTLLEASLRVSCGFSIMCANEGAARWILIVNGYWGAVGPEIHGDAGFFWHYHPHRHTHTHIWYY